MGGVEVLRLQEEADPAGHLLSDGGGLVLPIGSCQQQACRGAGRPDHHPPLGGARRPSRTGSPPPAQSPDADEEADRRGRPVPGQCDRRHGGGCALAVVAERAPGGAPGIGPRPGRGRHGQRPGEQGRAPAGRRLRRRSRPIPLIRHSPGNSMRRGIAGGLTVDVGGAHCRSRACFRGPMLSPHASAHPADELSGPSGLAGRDGRTAGMPGVWLVRGPGWTLGGATIGRPARAIGR